MADDALEVAYMNVKPGGESCEIQCMMIRSRKCTTYTVRGEKIARGMKMVLEERGHLNYWKECPLDACDSCQSS